MPKIKNWLFCTYCGKIKHWSEEGISLGGIIYNDPRMNPLTTEFTDGHRIITSKVVEINWGKQYVITRSGTRYELDGHINKQYEEWLQSDRKETLWMDDICKKQS